MKPDLLNTSMLSDRQSTPEEIRAAALSFSDCLEEPAAEDLCEILSDLGGYLRIPSLDFETCLMVEEFNRNEELPKLELNLTANTSIYTNIVLIRYSSKVTYRIRLIVSICPGVFNSLNASKSPETEKRKYSRRAGQRIVVAGGPVPYILREAETSNPSALERPVLKMGNRRLRSDSSIQQLLSSTIRTQDKKLGHILAELKRISAALKSDNLDAQALTNTLQRMVTCAAEQCVVDRELQSLALTDDLTSLYNRRAFLALAGQQLRLSRRKGHGLLLFFADVDHLKEINDRHGHPEGDLALIRTAKALERTFRDSDVIARLGGDEFAVLAPEACCEDREAILRRLETTLRGSNANDSRYAPSLSVGMARFDPGHPVSLDKLIASADEAMYEEKKNRSHLSFVPE